LARVPGVGDRMRVGGPDVHRAARMEAHDVQIDVWAVTVQAPEFPSG
jgi:hypothetical protein